MTALVALPSENETMKQSIKPKDKKHKHAKAHFKVKNFLL